MNMASLKVGEGEESLDPEEGGGDVRAANIDINSHQYI
jgi:hypothetical protein